MSPKFRFPLLVIVSLMTACSTSPTGRKQMTWLPESQLNSMGIQAFTQLKQETPTEANPKINAYVNCIVNPLTKVVDADGKGRKWEVVVFKSDQVNAFALPGGKIGVFTGIMKAAQNADQLAAVVGHEIGHVLARHGNERMTQALLAQGLLTAGGLVAGTEKKQTQILLGLAGLGAQGGLLYFSRTQESESDLIGLDIMARAGFDPRQSVNLWQNMKVAAGGGAAPPEFMSTHPSNERRIRDLQANIPKAMPAYESVKSKPACKL